MKQENKADQYGETSLKKVKYLIPKSKQTVIFD